jgi:hypothetical protein
MTNAEADQPPKKKPRIDGQITGLAGELFVAAELLKRGLQTFVTFGNAKSIDLLAYDPESRKSYAVQVKALRSKNFFLLSHHKVEKTQIYVFVLLNKPGQSVQYFVVPVEDLHNQPERFSKWFLDPKMPGIHPNTLAELGYEDAWHIFSASAA